MSGRDALDTSIVIAGLVTWHEEHEVARPLLEQAVAGDEAVLPAHALLEAYAVLTRLPPPHRMSPTDAFTLLSSSLRDRCSVQALGDEIWPTLENAATREVAGGTTYDAVILAEARRGGATAILTLDPAHFERLATREIVIRGTRGKPGG